MILYIYFYYLVFVDVFLFSTGISCFLFIFFLCNPRQYLSFDFISKENLVTSKDFCRDRENSELYTFINFRGPNNSFVTELDQPDDWF